MGELRVPLRQWRVRNFKSIERADLEFAPLTVLVGPNSSGKSSVLQSILVMVQAAQMRPRGDAFPLNGPLVELGEYREVRSAFARSRQAISIGGTLNVAPVLRPWARSDAELRRWSSLPADLAQTAEWELRFAGRDKAQPGSTHISQLRLKVAGGRSLVDEDTGLLIEARRRPGTAADFEKLLRGRLLRSMPVGELPAIAFLSGTQRTGKVGRSIHGAALTAGFPTNVLVDEDENGILATAWIENAIAQHDFTARERLQRPVPVANRDEILRALADQGATDIRKWSDSSEKQQSTAFRRFRESAQKNLDPKWRRALATDRGLPDLLQALLLQELGPGRRVYSTYPIRSHSGYLDDSSGILSFLSQRISYLGPLRQEPLPVYRVPPTGRGRFIGKKGEYAAAVLHALASEPIEAPLPSGGVRILPLSQAVNDWLAYLEAAAKVVTQDRGRLGYQMLVTPSDLNRALDLTNVGVGVSQVIPVVLQCLLAEPGSVVLLEQPELHLHPAMQQRLGDFFLACARSGRQLIVETHSEYLITRLRLRVAEDATDDTRRLVRLINAVKVSGRTTYSSVEVNEFGSIEAWPDGFFDQAVVESQALLEAGLAKQSAE